MERIEHITKMGKAILRLQQHFGSLDAAVEHLEIYSRQLAERDKVNRSIVELTCETYKLKLSEFNRSRKHHLPKEARFTVIFLLRTYFNAPIKEIALYVPYGEQTVRNCISELNQWQQNANLKRIKQQFFANALQIYQQTEATCQ